MNDIEDLARAVEQQGHGENPVLNEAADRLRILSRRVRELQGGRTKTVAEWSYYDGTLLDMNQPHYPIDVGVASERGRTMQMWVNVGPYCVLRIKQADAINIERVGEA